VSGSGRNRTSIRAHPGVVRRDERDVREIEIDERSANWQLLLSTFRSQRLKRLRQIVEHTGLQRKANLRLPADHDQAGRILVATRAERHHRRRDFRIAVSLRRVRQRKVPGFLAHAGSVLYLRGNHAGAHIARGEKSGWFAFFDSEYDHSAVRTRFDFRAVLEVRRNWVHGFFAHSLFLFVLDGSITF